MESRNAGLYGPRRKRYYEIMRTLPPLNDACLLEHRVAEILTEQEIHGWTFDDKRFQT